MRDVTNLAFDFLKLNLNFADIATEDSYDKHAHEDEEKGFSYGLRHRLNKTV